MSAKHGLALTLIFGGFMLAAAPPQAQQAGNWEPGFGPGRRLSVTAGLVWRIGE